MKMRRIFREPLIQRMGLLFVLLGLLPTLLIIILTGVYFLMNHSGGSGQALVGMWAAQSFIFLFVLLFGAGDTLKRLVIPIQELVKGANAITEGDLSYRVSVLPGNQELAALTQTFNAMAESVETMRDNIEKQRATLQNSLEKRDHEFEVILQIAGLVNKQADLTEIAQNALNIVYPVLGSDRFALALLDEDANISSSVFACKDCMHNRPTQCEYCQEKQLLRVLLRQMQDNLIKDAVESGDGIFVEHVNNHDTRLNPAALEILRQMDVRKLMIKPLQARGRVLGVLVFMRHTAGDVPEQSIALGRALAENIAVLLESRQLQDKARELTIMDERRRMASELHDSVTQSLFTLSLTARGLNSQLKGIPGVNHQALDMLVNQTKVIHEEMRTLINELRPINLGANDLEDALRQHVRSIRYSTNTEIKLFISGNMRRLPQPVQQNLNRIAQEALSNIARHAKASHAEIMLEVSNQTITLTISDNGIGFDSRSVALRPSSSLGLISMRERVEMLCGALMIRAQPGEGTTLTAQIPLDTNLEVADGTR